MTNLEYLIQGMIINFSALPETYGMESLVDYCKKISPKRISLIANYLEGEDRDELLLALSQEIPAKSYYSVLNNLVSHHDLSNAKEEYYKIIIALDSVDATIPPRSLENVFSPTVLQTMNDAGLFAQSKTFTLAEPIEDQQLKLWFEHKFIFFKLYEHATNDIRDFEHGLREKNNLMYLSFEHYNYKQLRLDDDEFFNFEWLADVMVKTQLDEKLYRIFSQCNFVKESLMSERFKSRLNYFRDAYNYESLDYDQFIPVQKFADNMLGQTEIDDLLKEYNFES